MSLRNLMALSACSVSSSTSSRTVCSLVAARAVRQRDQQAGASVFEEVVDAFELAGEQFVVMAELEQLRVRIFQQLDGGLGAGERVVEEGGIPADHGQVVRVVGDAAPAESPGARHRKAAEFLPRTIWAI